MPQSQAHNNYGPRRRPPLKWVLRIAAGREPVGPMRVSKLLVFLLALLLLPAAAGAARLAVPDGFPPSGKLVYEVIRDNALVGSNQVEFEHNGERLVVRTTMDIVVSILFIPVYRFTHRAEEIWMNGELQSFHSKTDDDGRARDVVLARDGDKLAGFYNGGAIEYPADLMPGSLWHPATVEQRALLETTKGQMRAVSVIDRGVETVKLASGAERARHFSISGELRREVWYGADGQIVQASFPAKDGSIVVLRLRR
jgi:hypothetical protein